MKQFNLSLWLQDKSRKICTRDGRPVRIVCWDLKCNTPIIAAIQWNQEREDCYCYNTVGWCANNEGELDLFFADDEDKMTEFEKVVQSMLNEPHFQDAQAVKQFSKTLLDLARKELLKDLPTWKKANDNLRLNKIVPHLLDDVLYWKGYYIWMKDLENLPKEE